MIELTPSIAINLYLGLTLALVLGIWFYHHYTSKAKKILPSDKRLYVCEYCHFAYLEESAKEVTQCPQCQSFNKDNSFRK